jgi:hypothetical protein
MQLAILIICCVNVLINFNLVGHVARFTSFLIGKLGGSFFPTQFPLRKEEKKP